MTYICKACTKMVKEGEVVQLQHGGKMHVSNRSTSPGETKYYCGPLEEDDLDGQDGLLVYT